jgi:hypothetical protein
MRVLITPRFPLSTSNTFQQVSIVCSVVKSWSNAQAPLATSLTNENG